jgi:hypothetical protein
VPPKIHACATPPIARRSFGRAILFRMPEYAAIAARFARALVSGEYDRAHSMLSPTLRARTSPAALHQRYAELLASVDHPLVDVRVSLEAQMDEWPDKKPHDAGWAYVSIVQDVPGATVVEAVTVIVTRDGWVRDVEWGRP